MKIKISDKIICISPHLSTTWDKVAFLQSERGEQENRFSLIIHFIDGSKTSIEGLDASIIDIAFSAHLQYLEQVSSKRSEAAKDENHPLLGLLNLSAEQMNSMPIRFNLGAFGGPEGMDLALQHNPGQADAPILPQELLEKIAKMAQIFANGDLSGFPKPETQCKCFHCQIARAIHGMDPEQECAQAGTEEAEEVVTEEDLSFRGWEITPVSDQLYLVKNPLDPKEQYSVYLGTPLGCTCGELKCEHIRAALNT